MRDDDISEIIANNILCGLCNASVRGRDEGDPDGQFGCSGCDNWALKDEVIQMAKDYIVDQTRVRLDRAMQDAASGSRILDLRDRPIANKNYRFIVDMKS